MNWSEEERTATWKWMDAEFDASQRTVFHQVRMLRNAIVHGTRPSGRHTGAITAALDDPERTRALLTQGIALLDHLLQAEPTPS